ncbi:MAG: glycosyltransferase [Burkholderiales bacterium]|nr:glycosyltransferase [Anaerolineae bacterium]
MAGTDAQSANGMKAPFVTVIMPVRNEGDHLRYSLGAVLAQDYPHDCFEVIIADGFSHDQTRSIARKTAAQCPDVCVTILDNPQRIVPTGFNLALAQAKGEYIVRVDGHTVIARDYLREIVAAFERSNAENVGGRSDAVSVTPLGRAIAIATSSPFGVGGGRFHYSQLEEYVDTVYMGAWRRDLFERIGGFDEEFVRNQDDEFNYRLRAHGGKILLTPRIRSSYSNRSTFLSLWRQYFLYGCWKIRVLQKHPRQMQPRQFAPPSLTAALIGTGLFALVSIWGRRLFALVIGAYALANGAASLYTASKRGWQHLIYLPAIFATLHLSYGIGFLWGLVKFWRRWHG